MKFLKNHFGVYDRCSNSSLGIAQQDQDTGEFFLIQDDVNKAIELNLKFREKNNKVIMTIDSSTLNFENLYYLSSNLRAMGVDADKIEVKGLMTTLHLVEVPLIWEFK